MNIIGATTTWNSIDLVEKFLGHYQKLGLRKFLVMDFNSSDGTQDVLNSSTWSDFVRLVPYPWIDHLDSSNIFLALAKESFPPETLCLFCDPDEFLVTPSMKICEAVWTGSIDRMGACEIPRFNMTALRDVAASEQALLTPFDALKYRINKRVRRWGSDMENEVLDPPWIFTDIPGKVLVRLEATTLIHDGDHWATCKEGEPGPAPEGVYLLHYPFRTWKEFEDKIEMAKIDYGINTYRPPSYGWQYRRWIRISNETRLYSEYLEQFIERDNIERLLADKTLYIDDHVRQFNTI